ncbi:C2 domain-containing protein 5 [Arctopsyche grandis]|uniref:C2 domain-containing protein 5 n=1 Tax=Arctopsyche grandis TaxID=121162 RepID=UPI00406D7D99
MPAKVKVKVLAGRDLPVMDKSSDTTDAYVELKLGGITHKTDVCRKSLNPHWSCPEWYRFEVDDAELQDEPLQLRLMDHDTYSANDAIGKVYISLNPLLLPLTLHTGIETSHPGKGAIMSGWIPVFDTMHGIRGEVNVIVKVELFNDFNKFRQSSCGVQFFHSPIIPHGYQVQAIHGFVEELVINDDPEYQWIDKIRTPRASNEARQVAFLKLNGQVQRKIGLKAIELGANAVIGFKRCLDLEGEVGVVARGAGTAVTLSRLQEPLSIITPNIMTSQVAHSPDTLQHQLKKYFEFINLDKSENIKSDMPYSHQLTESDILNRLPPLAIYGDDQLNQTQTEINSVSFTNTGENSSTMTQDDEKHMLQELLRQEDLRQDVSKKSLKKSIKKLRNSSQNLFNKKMRSMKTKRFDFSNDEETADRASISSICSDRSAKFSFTDIKNEIKRKSNLKSRLLKKSPDGGDGSGMAALLVRSVMHAHSSLDCIKESLESNSPSSTLRRSSKSQPKIEIPSATNKKTSPELSIVIDTPPNTSPIEGDHAENPFKLQFLSLDNISLNSDNPSGKLNLAPIKRVSESCPTTPKESMITNPYLSIPSDGNLAASSISSTMCSSDEYSSSDADDSDEISDGNKIISDCNLDTVSGVVRSVMEHQIDSNVISHMDEKLQNISPKSIESKPLQFEFRNDMWNSDPNIKYDKKENQCKRDSNVSNCTEVLSFQNAVDQTTIYMSNLNANKSYRASTGDLRESVHASTSSRDDNAQFSRKSRLPRIDPNLDLPPVMGGASISSTNLVDSALQTMLLDKVNVIGCYSSPATADVLSSPSSADPNKHRFRFHFPKNIFHRQTSEMAEKPLKNNLLQRASKLSLSSLGPLRKKFRTFSAGDKEDHPSLIKTAMQTILMEKVNIMGEIINNSPIVGDEEHLHGDLDIEHEGKHDSFELHSDVLSCYSDDSKHNTLDSHLDSLSQDLLSLSMKETVLGSPFLSYNELRCCSDPNVNCETCAKKCPDSLSYQSNNSHDMETHNLDSIATKTNIKQVTEFESSTVLQRDMKQLDRRRSLDDSKNNIEKIINKTDSQSVKNYSDISICTNDALGKSKNIYNTSKTSQDSSKDLPEFKMCIVDPGNNQKKNSCTRCGYPKLDGGSLTTGVCGAAVLRPSMNQDNLDLLEYPFLTIVKFPPGFIMHIGGAVAARSVKLLERVPNPEEPAPRDAWWSELRTEVRSHMRALRCNAVLAYQETTSISDDVCVLSATGTAAVIDLRLSSALPYNNAYPVATSIEPNKEHEGSNRSELTQTSSLDRTDFDKIENTTATNAATAATANAHKPTMENHPNRKRTGERCGPCHLPYNSGSVPFRVNVTKCAVCKKGRVPSVMLCSIEPIDGLSIVGRGCLVQAVASRARVLQRGEPAARDISDQLPFLEYELHRLLLAKLRVRGMNAIFGLKTTIAVGATVVAAVGVGTGVLLAALGASAGGPRLRAAPGDPRLLRALQRGLDDALHANRHVYHLNMESDGKEPKQPVIISDTEDSDEEVPDMEINAGNKDTCVLEVDDAEDLEVLKMLTEARPPAGLHVVNTQSVPGLPGCETLGSVGHLQMFTQLWRARLMSPTTSLHQHFHRLLQSVYFKLRRMVPCAVCDVRFRLDLPEADEIQLVVTGMALGIIEPANMSDSKIQTAPEPTVKKFDKETSDECPVKKSESNEMIFTLDEESSIDINNFRNMTIAKGQKQESPGHVMTNSTQTQSLSNSEWRPSVVMTPLATIPGGRILNYLGNLDFIFVRESTSVREQGGLSGFLHTFITEVLTVVRAHVTALGGNAIVAFYMTELILSDNPHKNQAQCLVSVGGDATFVSYFSNE